MTVLSVVLMFAFFILFYFPSRQEKYLMENYNEEIENFANTVALGVKIALTEQNFEGVETAIDFVRNDDRLRYVSLVVTDSLLNESTQHYTIDRTVFKTFPDSINVDPHATSEELFIIKRSPFSTAIMSGEIQLSFSTREIIESRRQIRLTSVIASSVVFIIGLGIGYILARNISKPVLALRDAANRVGEGDLTQSVLLRSKDEIGELGVAFNKMVRDLGIEAALEKVRNRTTGMHKSQELSEVIEVLFNQIQRLGLSSTLYILSVHDRENGESRYWVSDSTGGKLHHFKIPYQVYPLHKHYDQVLEKQEPYRVIMIKEKQKKEFEELLFDQLELDISQETKDRILKSDYSTISASFGEFGSIEILDQEALSKEKVAIFKRFTSVFEQTYTRYTDLQNSEYQAKDRVKRASLERVRAEIASMRSKDDLNQITPIVWTELKTLEVPFIRCGVFIVDEKNKTVQSYLSTPDGKSLGVFNIKTASTSITKNVVDFWKKKEVYKEHWGPKEFTAWTNSLIKMGHIKKADTYQGSKEAPESLDLHFVPFKQGMLYVGNSKPLTSYNIEMVKSLAEVFSIAYARYEDFKELELAKNRIEKTLSELKSTQTQLVHSEKMASLGELTAGIAHEIQNPLNFVNNFSELSVDLIEEMNEEIEAGNMEYVVAISGDLKMNLEKINFHGNRASSIVKGMLEHSRAGSKEKELTDLNVLADEYLRLAYHGLRAKDKSFNADFKADLDPNLPKIHVLSQDISRVLLNLVNNAFYAVAEKSKKGIENYRPSVTISTKWLKGKAEIRIKDNADGIPPEVLEKIFNPFFTTKPTGKGTGLGLSISFDIITKGHNGTLKVETATESQNGVETGTEFIIELPE